MDAPRLHPVLIGLTTALLLGVALGPVATADPATAQCLTDTQEEPLVGDGPTVGDASGHHAVPVSASTCWNGQLKPYTVDPFDTPSPDTDTFLLQPTRGRYLFHLEAVQGCGNVSITLHSNGATASEHVCADDADPTVIWGILDFTQATLEISEGVHNGTGGDLVYMFLYE